LSDARPHPLCISFFNGCFHEVGEVRPVVGAGVGYGVGYQVTQGRRKANGKDHGGDAVGPGRDQAGLGCGRCTR
jgi:hypothetical protein